jgi:threonine/homoserine/homoserine lactone efflux protein
MGELILSLVPLAIVAALQPPQVIALVILMQTKRGTVNGWAYFAGMAAFRLTLGAIFWMLISNVERSIETAGGRFEIFVGAILTVLGFLLLVYALRQGLTARNPDEAAMSWLVKLESATTNQAALMGLAFLAMDPKDWLVDISAVDLIAGADLSGRDSLLAYLVYVLLAQSVLLVPLVMALVSPLKAHEILARLKNWLERYERQIMVLIAALLGCFFLYAGLEQLGMF